MEERTTIRLNEYTVGVLEQAMRVWPECKGNRSEAIRRVMADWDRIRNENGGGKSAKVERRVEEDGAQTRREIAELRQQVAALTVAMADVQVQLAHLLKGEL